MTDKPIIVHISNDYPDIMAPNKTKAVINLVEGTPQYRHVVYSLNRVSGLSGLVAQEFGEDRFALAYGALPKGFLWERRLPEIARWIIADLKEKGITPDLVEAHKFTVEGIIGYELSTAFSCPLICDIQGGTDFNILKKKPSLRGLYKKIAKRSSAILPYAPWPLDLFEEKIELDRAKCTLLPVVPGVNAMRSSNVVSSPKIMSVFHLDEWQRKNFEGMALAIKHLVEAREKITLDVYGGGCPKSFLDLKRIIDQHNLHEYIRIMGPTPNGALPEVMQDYVGLSVPSKTESFGLVYVEALFSGLPVLLNKSRGIAGYLPMEKIGYGCDASDPVDIANGFLYLVKNQVSLKSGIASMQKKGGLDLFLGDTILQSYNSVLERTLQEK